VWGGLGFAAPKPTPASPQTLTRSGPQRGVWARACGGTAGSGGAWPLKLVLLESAGSDARGSGTVGALNHLGVEVSSTDEVGAATTRLASEGLATASEENTTCCYALQDKVWVNDPDAPAEVTTPARVGDSACCGGTAAADDTPGQPAAAACC
jgi:hypothetical protein